MRDGSFSFSLSELPPEVLRFRVTVEPATVANRFCGTDSVTVSFDFATLSGSANNGTFGGVLFSSVEACEPNRVILLYEISADPAFVGSDFARRVRRLDNCGGKRHIRGASRLHNCS